MDSRRNLPLAVVVAAVAALAASNLSCGGGSPTSTPVTTLAPTPTPTTTTAPAATCNLGRGVTYPGCEHTSSQLLPDLERAMDRLIQDKPGIFDLSNEYAPGTRAYKILDRDKYMDGLVAELMAAGLCAERDVDDVNQQTLRVKDSNEFSEDFDVILRNNYMRRGVGAYDQTCTPPNFPANRPPDAPPVGSGCYRPFPPKLYKMVCRDYLNAGDHHVIDSTPWVADSAYCAKIGYTDGRGQCPVRVDTAPDRKACELWIVGTAQDTGEPGPTWTRVSDGAYCTDKASGCVHSPDSKFQLWVYEHGYYQVSGNKGGVACQAYVDK
jgi:hypothetical protein